MLLKGKELDVNELYSDLKVKYEKLKHMKICNYKELQELRKKCEVLEKENKILQNQISSIEDNQKLGWVKEKTHRKLQERMAELNTYCRKLENDIINLKDKDLQL